MLELANNDKVDFVTEVFNKLSNKLDEKLIVKRKLVEDLVTMFKTTYGLAISKNSEREYY